MISDDDLMRRLKKALPDKDIVLKEDVIMNAINKKERTSSARNPFLGMQAILGGAGAVLIGTVAVFGITTFQTPKEDLIINLASSQPGNASGFAGAAGDTGAREDAKMSLPYPYFKDTYVPGGNLSSATSEDNIYRLEPIPSDKLAALLKKAFNINGKEKIESGEGWYSLTIGAANEKNEIDYNQEYISINGSNKDAVLYWNYSNNTYWNLFPQPYYDDSVDITLNEEIEEGYSGAVIEEWREPNPSEPAVMKKRVSEILSELGYNANEYSLNVDRDYATAAILLDGEETPIEFYFNFYENNLVYAGGYAVQPNFNDLGVYPLMSEYESVDRMNQYGFWASAPSFVYRDLYPVMPPVDYTLVQPDDVYVSEDTKAEPNYEEGESSYSGSSFIEPDNTSPIMPCLETEEPYCMPEPVERIIEIDKAVQVWVMIWSADGDIYLVRGFVLTGEYYAFGVVNAVPDFIIKLPEYSYDVKSATTEADSE